MRIAWLLALLGLGKDRSGMCYQLRRSPGVLVLGLALLAISAGQAREPQSAGLAANIDVERVGPQVGTALPNFSLRDEHGEAHSLKSLLGPKGAVIVFFRSADW
jgi:hypothetical protein